MEKGSLVIYKTQPALVLEAGDKYTIQFQTSPATSTGKKAQYGTQKVRDKDVMLLHEGPVQSLETVLNRAESSAVTDEISAALLEAWELLLSDDETAATALSPRELAELSTGDFPAENAWAFFKTASTDAHFAQSPLSDGTTGFIPRSEEEASAIISKAQAKEQETEIREAFLKRLKEKKLDLPSDAKYMQEVEALALGSTDKSRVMKDAGIKETPEKAHKLLLDTGVWPVYRNPHPARHGVSMQSATDTLPHPPEEERLELTHTAWAIDSEWSADPDDAIAFEAPYLWVHIADPASAVLPDSKIDIASRNRGATLYSPEGAARMLAEEALEDYALGLSEHEGGKRDGALTGKKSRALSFRMQLDDAGNIVDAAVLKTFVHVERLSYSEADGRKNDEALAPLFSIAQRNIDRRTSKGAVSITLPEVHISIDEEHNVIFSPSEHYESSDLIREMMLLAGEAAARFAFKNKIAFPFVSQEAPDIPKDLPEGLAGQYRLRRCMRSRSVGITPSQHAGLGLGMYSQVTSPLRRYSDLVAHQQLRAFIDGRELLDKDEMLLRISAGDAAASATIKAERESNMHWTLVYLLQHPEWTGKGIIVELRQKQTAVLIPEFALETVLTPDGAVNLNDEITLKAGNINLPELSVTFQQIH